MRLKSERTHNCAALRAENIGEKVVLMGWVHRRRDHGGVIFIDLRDRLGLTQIVFRPETEKALHEKGGLLRSEWVIEIHGVVTSRGEGMANPKLKTGEIEVEVHQLEILSKSKTPPFSICDETIEVNEELRLKYRYLEIRRGEIANHLALRHKTMLATRNYLSENSFIEINTPILAKTTPEGARDYLVPSRVQPGSFYALPQSPQLFKQLLMISGMERYFQLAPCFRDEDLRSDRQPEFHQIDIELSFSTYETFFPLMEGLISTIFKETVGLELSLPFRTLPYREAMERYGTDKPDLRFGMELIRLDDIGKKSDFAVFKEAEVIKGICVKNGASLSRKQIDGYTSFVGQFGAKGLAWIKMGPEGPTSSIVKFFSTEVLAQLVEKMGAETGDLLLFVASDELTVNQSLDHLRREIGKEQNLFNPDQLEFVWITEFPLFLWDQETGRYACVHHPFTAPFEEDIPLLDTDPLSVRSASYDLVLNGYEIGGGSCRIYDSELQEKIFNLLKLSEDDIKNRFGFFVEALQYGTPPHMGIAFGLDRILMLLCKTENIRDVIAFPKTQRATDLMMEAPSDVLEKQLTELKIHVHKDTL
ncbi:MAG: Aspartate--tRNA(Asp/Asn) ligase [Chlamydiales bacterium]|nr:Aspartate--tRNA(Asp/Asn) ligase [Chlamydiales bacterium]MCH9619751.1 Aspartate--tRNA(Asp/Asn) ligase [Chlamydiales bacterium]MCH9623357.1 Aspartate--tRNA(Asp/Asn) ligase [Chlamydiales bacterium]